jgi:hypothetical protein
MGYIREPKGIDFIINGKPLTDKVRNSNKKRITQTPRIGQGLYV